MKKVNTCNFNDFFFKLQDQANTLFEVSQRSWFLRFSFSKCKYVRSPHLRRSWHPFTKTDVSPALSQIIVSLLTMYANELNPLLLIELENKIRY